MHRILFLTSLFIAPLGTIAHADIVGENLFSIGREYCQGTLDRDIIGIDGAPFRQALAAAEYGQTSFCDCVGARFREDGDDETANELQNEIAEGGEHIALRSMLENRMEACLPADGMILDLGLDDGILDFDLVADAGTIEDAIADNDFPANEGDIHACQLAFADDMMLPGFSAKTELARLRKSGQTVDEVCRCAASYITSLGEEFEKEVEEAMNPSTIYGSALAGGINICING